VCLNAQDCVHRLRADRPRHREGLSPLLAPLCPGDFFEIAEIGPDTLITPGGGPGYTQRRGRRRSAPPSAPPRIRCSPPVFRQDFLSPAEGVEFVPTVARSEALPEAIRQRTSSLRLQR
jgi:hypothetical protein